MMRSACSIWGLSMLAMLAVCGELFAQDRYAFQFNNEPLERALETIEQESSYVFYFDKAWLEGVVVTENIGSSNMEEVLQQVLEDSKLQFVAFGSKIILTLNAPIITSLKEGDEPEDNLQYLFEREYETGTGGEKVTVVGDKSKMEIGGESLLAGFVKNEDTGDPVSGAVLFLNETEENAVTDGNGFYTLKIPNGNNKITVRFSGMKQEDLDVLVFSDGELNLEMEQEAILLDEVAVTADADVNISNVKMGVSKMNMEELKNVPKVLSENDLIQVALALPGVQNVGEGAAGLNVRGGKSDQNLILLNGATVYNPFHFFGFFSVFNPDVIGETELYKSSIPVNFGGRLSALLDVNQKVGDKEKFSGSGGISPITTRLNVEVPLIKGKTSLVTGVRTTYSDWVLNQVNNERIKSSDPSFFDISSGIHHSYGANSSIHAGVYYSKDEFKITTDSLYSYFNFNASLTWTHFLNEKLSTQLKASTSKYAFDVDYEFIPESAFNYGFEINDRFGQLSLNYFPNDQHEIQVGADARRYDLSPGAISPLNASSEVVALRVEDEQGRETSFFIADNFALNKDLTFYGGLRYSIFTALGARTINSYLADNPKNENTFLSSETFSDGEAINTYSGPELRLSLRYALSTTSSVKAAYTQTRQYLHALSNNVSISPTDSWKLSDPNFAPQLGKQFSAGYYRNFRGNTIETSLETYYKTFDNLLDYKVGADLTLNPELETEVIRGDGRAYGVEVYVKKNTGKLNGWVSYAYSRSQQRFNSAFAEETINNGSYFSTNHEKPHDFSLVSNYKHTRRYSVSFNLSYSTGRPITYPTARYNLSGTEIVHFSDRNQFRIPDYFRMDISLNVEGSHRVNKVGHGYWSFSIYNLTSRKNVYSIFFTNDQGSIKGYELSVLGSAIPSIAYNFKF